ncbi:MAG: Hsp20/alpha crystallin family protein [Candidatus Omnitrophica bacterium]|nr:Hsp20/alpha crystallin family protein [Candidatus Omnitrophota bacterium]
MELVKNQRNVWDPLDVIWDLQSDLNRAFNRSLIRQEGRPRNFDPQVEVQEQADHFLVQADLPGLKKEDFSIKVQGTLLTLSGERKIETEKTEKKSYYSERSYGAFARTLEFPVEIQADKVKASYREGVLEITLPKAESSKAREISVEVK